MTIALYLAKAHFKIKNFQKCREMTTRMLVKHPNDFRLKYNLALCLQEMGNEIFGLSQRRVKQTEQAIKDLKIAKSLLTQFLALYSTTNG